MARPGDAPGAGTRPSPDGTAPFGWTDGVVLAALAALAGFVAYRTQFVLVYHWDWSVIPRFVARWDGTEGRWVPNLLLLGLFTTLRLTVWGGLLALLVGLVVAVARIGRPLAPRLAARTYVECVRNIPELVFIFIFYFFVSSQLMPLLGLDTLLKGGAPTTLAVVAVLFGDPSLFTSFVPAVIAIGLFEAAAVSEILRAGLQSVERGQWEAAAALGLSRRPTLRLVVLPQALKRILPPLAGQLIALVKDSSLAAVVSVPELTFSGNEVAVSIRGMFEIWLTVGAIYFAICSTLSLLFARMERRRRSAPSAERSRRATPSGGDLAQ